MPDIDKLQVDKWPPLLQWIIGVGALIGATAAGWMGARHSRTDKAEDEDASERHRQELDRLRDSEAKLLQLQAENRLRADLVTVIEAVKLSIREEMLELERRLRQAENDLAGMRRRRHDEN